MAFPFGPLPTLNEFVAVAKSMGCDLIHVTGVLGPDGQAIDSRCLVGPPPARIPYPLPGIRDDEHLTPGLIGSIERTLGIKTGFPST
jgi:hypothetical protein